MRRLKNLTLNQIRHHLIWFQVLCPNIKIKAHNNNNKNFLPIPTQKQTINIIKIGKTTSNKQTQTINYCI